MNLTDNEIIKALEHLIKNAGNHIPVTGKMLLEDVLGVLNRQEAELELSRRFQIKEIHIDDELCKECQYETKQVISETIKEFAERLKRVKVHSLERHENVVPVAQIDWVGQLFIKEKWEEIK